MGIRIGEEEDNMAGAPEYHSVERVYELDDAGQPVRLLYPVGAVIPAEEAARQGLVGGKVRSDAADKIREPAANKTTSTPRRRPRRAKDPEDT